MNIQQVTYALLQLRQRNKYQDNAAPPWYWLITQGSLDAAEPSEPWALDRTPVLSEIAVSARKQADLMVFTAVKVCLIFSSKLALSNEIKSTAVSYHSFERDLNVDLKHGLFVECRPWII